MLAGSQSQGQQRRRRRREKDKDGGTTKIQIWQEKKEIELDEQ